jgi:hypothetical protein
LSTSYTASVFLNVPFDERYKPIFYALVFAIHDCGFVARSALETDDGSQVRIDKIYDLIRRCKYGIHDISRTAPDGKTQLPRFNMPLELGIFMGAKRYGGQRQKAKRALILDSERYRYQKFCSDIAGQDVRAHGDSARGAIRCVRDWLRACPDTKGISLPSTNTIVKRYLAFHRQLPRICRQADLDLADLAFNDYTILVVAWLRTQS